MYTIGVALKVRASSQATKKIICKKFEKENNKEGETRVEENLTRLLTTVYTHRNTHTQATSVSRCVINIHTKELLPSRAPGVGGEKSRNKISDKAGKEHFKGKKNRERSIAATAAYLPCCESRLNRGCI